MRGKITIFTVICCFIFGISIVKSQDAMDLIVEGNSLNNEKNYTSALEKFKAALKIDKNNYLAQFGIGYAHFRLNSFDTALVYFQKTLKAQKNFEKAYYYSGVIRYNLKKFTQAVYDFDRVLEINNNNFDALYFRALSLEKSGYFSKAANDYKILSFKNDKNQHFFLKGCINRGKSNNWHESIFEFDELIKIALDFDSVYFYKGLVYLQNDSTLAAYKCFTKAIELNKNYTEAYIYRGRAKQKMDSTTAENEDLKIWKTINPEYTKQELENAYNNFYDNEHYQAIDHFNNVVASDSNQRDALYSLAKSYFQINLLTKSEYVADITISKFPQKWEAHLLKADNYLLRYKRIFGSEYYGFSFHVPYTDSIKQIIKRVIKNDPQNHYVHSLSANYLDAINDPKEALNEINIAIEMNPEIAYYYQRVNLYLKSKDYEEALADIEKIIKLEGEKSEIKFFKAILISLDGDKKKGAELIEELFEDELYKTETFISRGLYYMYILKDYPSAIRDFTSALSLNPYFPDAYNYRSKAKWEVDDKEGSQEDYKMYLNIYE